MKSNAQYKQTEIGEIPEKWNLVELRQVVDKVVDNRGKTPPTQDTGIELLEVNAIVEGEKFPDYNKVRKYVSNETYSTWFRAGHPEKNDILIPTVGTIGNAAVMHESRGSIAQNLVALRLKKDIADSHFVYYLLTSPNTRNKLLNLNIGGVQPSIKVPHLLDFVVAIPEMIEQQQIASILSSLDDKIELNRKMNKTLEEIGKALFKRWFVDFEFPNENGEPYKSSGGEMVESELGEIPKGWKVKPLAHVYDFLEGPGIRNWQYADEGTRFINIRLINNGNIDVLSSNFINQDDVDNKYQHFLLDEGDMVVSTSGTLGRSAIVRKSHLPLLLNTSVIRFRPKQDVGYAFMYLYLQSEEFLNEQIRLSSGSVQKNFGPTHLKQMKIILPKKSLLDLFNTVGEGLYKQIIANMNESEILLKLRDSLLPRLMSGKIRVS